MRSHTPWLVVATKKIGDVDVCKEPMRTPFDDDIYVLWTLADSHIPWATCILDNFGFTH